MIFYNPSILANYEHLVNENIVKKSINFNPFISLIKFKKNYKYLDII